MNLPAGDSNQGTGESLANELAHALDFGDMANPVNVGSREAAAEPPQTPQQPGDGQDPLDEDPNALAGAQDDSDGDDGAGLEGDEGGEDDGTEIRKFTDLTALFGDEEVTAEDLYNLELVSGDGESLTVGQLKDMYQQRQAFETEKAEFAKQREQQAKELEEARQQATLQTGEIQQLPQELREAEAVILSIRQQAQTYDWAKLEQEDPGEAALLRQKFRDAHDAAVAKHETLWKDYNVKRGEAWQSFIAGQKEKMFQRIPEWRDDDTLTQERKDIDTLVAKYGFTSQEMDSVVDPRLSQLLRDYMLLRKKFDAALKNHTKVKQRGNKVLRTTVRSKPKARLQQIEERARSPEATRQDKHEAQKALLQQAGFL